MYVEESVLDVSTARGIFERNANCAQPRELGTDYSYLNRSSTTASQLPVSQSKQYEKSNKDAPGDRNTRVKSPTSERERRTPFTTERAHGPQRGVWGYSSLGRGHDSWRTCQNAHVQASKHRENIQPGGIGIRSKTHEMDTVNLLVSTADDSIRHSQKAHVRSNTDKSEVSSRTKLNVKIDKRNAIDKTEVDTNLSIHPFRIKCLTSGGGTNNDHIMKPEEKQISGSKSESSSKFTKQTEKDAGCKGFDEELRENEPSFNWTRWHSMRRKKTTTNTPTETQDAAICIKPCKHSDITPVSDIRSQPERFAESDKGKSRLPRPCSSEHVKSPGPEHNDAARDIPLPSSSCTLYKSREESIHSGGEEACYMDMGSSNRHDSLPISAQKNNARASWTLPRACGNFLNENTRQAGFDNSRLSLPRCNFLQSHVGVHEETMNSQIKDDQKYDIQMPRPGETNLTIGEDGKSLSRGDVNNQYIILETRTKRYLYPHPTINKHFPSVKPTVWHEEDDSVFTQCAPPGNT